MRTFAPEKVLNFLILEISQEKKEMPQESLLIHASVCSANISPYPAPGAMSS